MKVSATIMAHPVRAPMVEELTEQLPNVEVVWDHEGPPTKDPKRRWRIGRECWESHDPHADWHIVVQDDAVVSPDMLAGLGNALDYLGTDGLVSAYCGSGRPDQRNVRIAIRRAERDNLSWLSTRSLGWGVGICAPVHSIYDMLKWCSTRDMDTLNYDYRIGVYYRDVVGWRTWYTFPSLVDHRDEQSLVGHDNVIRVAHRWCSESALNVDWSKIPKEGLDPNLP